MNFPRLGILLVIILFGAIGLIAFFKKQFASPPTLSRTALIQEIPLEPPSFLASSSPSPSPVLENLPNADRIHLLFDKNCKELPIVENIVYKSRVDWQQGRPAWLSDYARHYRTSRHFIARSLRGEADYFNQEIKEGDKFNVLRLDKNFQFYLLVDLPRCLMWFYYDDLDEHKRVLLKRYRVSVEELMSQPFRTP